MSEANDSLPKNYAYNFPHSYWSDSKRFSSGRKKCFNVSWSMFCLHMSLKHAIHVLLRRFHSFWKQRFFSLHLHQDWMVQKRLWFYESSSKNCLTINLLIQDVRSSPFYLLVYHYTGTLSWLWMGLTKPSIQSKKTLVNDLVYNPYVYKSRKLHNTKSSLIKAKLLCVKKIKFKIFYESKSH